MSSTGHEGPPVGRLPRRVGRIVVIVLVLTVGVQLGDAALLAVQGIAEFDLAGGTTNAREQAPNLKLGGLSVDRIADRLLGFFRLDTGERDYGQPCGACGQHAIVAGSRSLPSPRLP